MTRICRRAHHEVAKFSDSQKKTTDLSLSGQTRKVVTEMIIKDIDVTIKRNRRQNIRGVATEFIVFIGAVHHIVPDQPTSFFTGGIRNFHK